MEVLPDLENAGPLAKVAFFGHFWLLKLQFDLRFVWPIYALRTTILPQLAMPITRQHSTLLHVGGAEEFLTVYLVISCQSNSSLKERCELIPGRYKS